MKSQKKRIKIILKRIGELKRKRNTLTQSGNSRTKYNFAIGELMNILKDTENE